MTDGAHERLELPDSLLTIDTTENAVAIYCQIGLKPIPLHAPTETGGCSCGKVHDTTSSGGSSTGKHPIQPNWQKKELSYDEIRDQIARCKFRPNVGLVLGKQPTGDYLIAIDVDDEERMAVLEQELGPLPETPRCDSGRGYRLFFLVPPEVDADQLQNTTAISPGASGKDKIPGVDAKVERGQVVVAPSRHANGKRYVWTVAGRVALLPVHWALQLVKKLEVPKFVQKYTPAEMSRPGAARRRAERYLEVAVIKQANALAACGEGNRNNTLYSTALRMFELCAGLHQTHQLSWVQDEIFRAAKSCGLGDNESRQTIASAERRARETGNIKVPEAFRNPGPPTDITLPPSAVQVVSSTSTPAAQPSTPPGAFTAPPPPSDPWGLSPESQRAVIKVTHELHVNVEQAIQALRDDDNLYQREKKLVYITRVTQEQSNSSISFMGDDGQIHHQLVEGTPQICDMEIPTVRERLSKIATFKKWVEKQQNYTPILPTDEIVSAVHKRKQWDGIRSIVGVVETPTMRPDGQIVQTSGYDKITRYLYMPSEKFPEVTDKKATQDNARWALSFLNEIFADFPYVNEAHRMVPIAAILTLIARPAILGSIPAILFDASTRGSGKTLQTDAIATVTTGRGAPRMNYTVDETELEKILAGYALKGSTFICLDNVPAMRPFGGGPIDRVITARDEVDLRVLGATKVLTLPWRALVMATGNNISLYGDTSRRVLMARLEPQEESPERRTKFRHEDLLGWVRKERPRLVAAALLMLRAYFLAGCPKMGCARWGSFEEWSRLIPNAIKFAGGSDPMLARPESDEEADSEFRNIKCFVEGMHRLMEDEYFRVSTAIDFLYKSERKRDAATGEFAPDGLEDIRDAIASIVGRKGFKFEGGLSAPDPTELGRRMGAFKGRVIGGLRLASKTGGGGTMRWRVEKVFPMSVGTELSEHQPAM